MEDVKTTEEVQKGRTSFLKQKVQNESVSDRDRANAPVIDHKRGIVFVNSNKYARAKRTLDFIRGNTVPNTPNEVARIDHYRKQLAINEVDPNSDDALPALYELYGGLIRTPAEQKVADEQREEAQTKGKRRMIDHKIKMAD